ncbi:MAG: FAD-dependent oxidoreductase [Candidatus Pacearchaeota archaeon]|nr:FAD-dependent oxidoreductase [Candidatus Pacearchaeota archaeon]
MKKEETAGISNTAWLATTKPLKFSPLKKNISVDTVIVGGGISGLTTAYMLAENGKKVAVVEDGYLGSGETGRTTAHLSYVLDRDYSEIIKVHGAGKTRVAAESHKQAIDMIEEIIQKEEINCDFERLDGFLFGPHADLKEELKSLYSVNLHEVKFTDPPIDSLKTRCLLFPKQGQFHVMKYLNGLAKAIIKHKGQIFTETHAEEIDENGITTNNGFRIKAKNVVVATNAPVNDNSLYMKQAPYRTYVIAGLIPKESVPRILLWDTEEPYHYVRTQDYDNFSDLLIVGGEDHRTAHKNDGRKRYLALEKFARKIFPMIKNIVFRWSGQVLESADGLAFIGKNPGSENVYVATGDSGSGMTHGTIAGMLISDLILGKKNPWQEIYNPARKDVFATKKFLQETVNTTEQYFEYFKIDHVYPRMKKDEGTILQAGLKKVAAYKDKRGKVHLHSAVCPHKGCVVQWNDSEKSFDCPCHGSRFTAEGNVVNGPANSGLKPWKEKKK